METLHLDGQARDEATGILILVPRFLAIVALLSGERYSQSTLKRPAYYTAIGLLLHMGPKCDDPYQTYLVLQWL